MRLKEQTQYGAQQHELWQFIADVTCEFKEYANAVLRNDMT